MIYWIYRQKWSLKHFMFSAGDKRLNNVMLEYQTKLKRERMKMLDLLSI